jgi:hypothetical protein
MNLGDTTVFLSTEKIDEALIPETWIKFFNGPNAGMIDLETARRDMPWLVSADVMSLKVGEVRQCVRNGDQPSELPQITDR